MTPSWLVVCNLQIGRYIYKGNRPGFTICNAFIFVEWAEQEPLLCRQSLRWRLQSVCKCNTPTFWLPPCAPYVVHASNTYCKRQSTNQLIPPMEVVQMGTPSGESPGEVLLHETFLNYTVFLLQVELVVVGFLPGKVYILQSEVGSNAFYLLTIIPSSTLN